MTPAEQINAFHGDLTALIERYRREFDLTCAAAIGTLEIVKLQLWDAEKEAQQEEGG